MMANKATKTEGRRPISSGDLDLVIAECLKGIGAIIGSPESKDLIAGVRVQPFPVYTDDRGYFLEVQRIGNGKLLRVEAAIVAMSRGEAADVPAIPRSVSAGVLPKSRAGPRGSALRGEGGSVRGEA